MKQIISIMIAALYLMLFSAPAFAAAGSSGLFIPESDAGNIAANLYDQQAAYPFIFGTENVQFDFGHVTPVYEISHTIQGDASSLSEITVFTGRYMLPAADLQGNILGIVTLEQIGSVNELPEALQADQAYIDKSREHQGKWEIASFKEGIDQNTLAVLSGEQDVSRIDSKVYYLEMGMIEDAGLLYVSDNTESYASFTAPANKSLTFSPNSTKDVLSKIANLLMLEENPNNSGTVTLSARSIMPFVSAGFLVVLTAAAGTVYLLKRRQKQV